MNTSAVRTLFLAALLLSAGCGPPEPGAAAEKAQAAWKLYLKQPDPSTYENFIRANRAAADLHAMPHDAPGIEYQVRALEVMAAEAERTRDLNMADDVTDRIEELERRDLVGVYEDTLSGARERLAAAKSRAGAVTR
jgi:hypothetical protein